MSHDYSNQSTEEDPRMMAFFDSLVQRELEGWSTDDSAHDSEGGSNYQPFVVRGDTSDDSNSDTMSNPSLHSGDEEGGLSPFTMAFAIAMARRARQPEDDDGGGDGDRPEDILDVRSSFMQRLDELNNDGAGDGESSSASALPGQRPNSARKSITELINQKRKECLIKAKNDMVSMKKNTSGKANKRKTDEGSSSSSSSGSSSSSSNSDDESGEDSNKEKSGDNMRKNRMARNKKKAKKRKLEDHDAEPNPDAADVMKELAAKRDKMKSRMKRLKAIRSRALLDLSDSSDSDKGASTSQTKCSVLSPTGVRQELNGQSQSCTDRSVSAKDACKFNENGQEIDSKLFTSASCANECNDAKSEQEICDNASKQESTRLKGIQNGNVSNGTTVTVSDNSEISCPKKAPFSTFCDNDTIGSVTNSVNGHSTSVNTHYDSLNGHASLVNGHGNTVSNGASTSDGESGTTDSQPVWAQFKRFRNRVEKAHRQYRRSSTHRENSGCSSGEEG